MTNRLEDHPHYAEAVAWAEEHGFGGTGPSARGVLFAYLSGYDEASKGRVSEDEAHEIGYSKGQITGYYAGVNDMLTGKRVATHEQWGVYYKDSKYGYDDVTISTTTEKQARTFVAASPADRGLRRRYVTEWKQVD